MMRSLCTLLTLVILHQSTVALSSGASVMLVPSAETYILNNFSYKPFNASS
jgi:hypothetical protein